MACQEGIRLAVLHLAFMPRYHWQAPSVWCGYPLFMFTLMAFMPNYIAYPVGTDASDSMTVWGTECPVPVNQYIQSKQSDLRLPGHWNKLKKFNIKIKETKRSHENKHSKGHEIMELREKYDKWYSK